MVLVVVELMAVVEEEGAEEKIKKSEDDGRE